MERKIGVKFGKRLRELREAKAITQAELAKLILKSVEAISNFERGKPLPSVRTVARMGEALGVPPHDFFDFGDPVAASDPLAVRISHRISKISDADRRLVADFIDLLSRHRRSN
jgi:transcriptional regulator with XRE-family HTH domain